jgi:hypothetical protein
VRRNRRTLAGAAAGLAAAALLTACDPPPAPTRPDPPAQPSWRSVKGYWQSIEGACPALPSPAGQRLIRRGPGDPGAGPLDISLFLRVDCGYGTMTTGARVVLVVHRLDPRTTPEQAAVNEVADHRRGADKTAAGSPGARISAEPDFGADAFSLTMPARASVRLVVRSRNAVATITYWYRRVAADIPGAKPTDADPYLPLARELARDVVGDLRAG